MDDNFKNTTNSEIKILEVKIQEIQKAFTAAKKANSTKQPIIKKVPVSKCVSAPIPPNNPLPAKIVSNTTPVTFLKITVRVGYLFFKIVKFLFFISSVL